MLHANRWRAGTCVAGVPSARSNVAEALINGNIRAAEAAQVAAQVLQVGIVVKVAIGCYASQRTIMRCRSTNRRSAALMRVSKKR